jgi:nitroreductase
MELFAALKERYSYRGTFTDAPVPEADLVKIVEAGVRAPSGVNFQTTSFVIVNEPERLQAIADILPDKPSVQTAQAMIACVVDPNKLFMEQSFAVEDCAAAVAYMLLAITDCGYATVWLDGVLRAEHKALRIAKLLGVPEDQQVRVLLPIGVPSEPGEQAPRKPIEERMFLNEWKEIDAD